MDKLTISDLTKQMHELVKSKGWYEKDSKRPQTPHYIFCNYLRFRVLILKRQYS